MSSLLCDRGWTEHLHHLIYDPLRCTDNKREKAPRCFVCRRARAHSRRINLHMDVTGAAGERERQRGKKQTGTPMLPPPKSNSSWRSPGLAGRGGGKGGENDLDVPRIGHWRRDNAVFVSTGCDCSRRDTERTVECGMIR